MVRKNYVTEKRIETEEKGKGSLTCFNWVLIGLHDLLFSLFLALIFHTKFCYSPPPPTTKSLNAIHRFFSRVYFWWKSQPYWLQHLCAVAYGTCPCTGMWRRDFTAVDKSFYSMQTSSVTKELLPCTINILGFCYQALIIKAGLVHSFVLKKGAPS